MNDIGRAEVTAPGPTLPCPEASPPSASFKWFISLRETNLVILPSCLNLFSLERVSLTQVFLYNNYKVSLGL